MIVECPNCSLEQPLDQYCAGCGKQLDKLLAEKNSRLSARVKKINFVFSFIFISFLSGSYLYYSNLNSNQNILEQNNSLKKNHVRINISKAKITRDPKARTSKTSKESPAARKKNLRRSKNIFPASVIKNPAPKKKILIKKISNLYLVSFENCINKPVLGEINNVQLSTTLDCASIHFQTTKLSTEDIIEESSFFSTQISIKTSSLFVELSFTLTTDQYVEEFKQALPLKNNPDSAATLWLSSGHEIEAIEAPSLELLSSYATAGLFKLSNDQEPPPTLYFLASYN